MPEYIPRTNTSTDLAQKILEAGQFRANTIAGGLQTATSGLIGMVQRREELSKQKAIEDKKKNDALELEVHRAYDRGYGKKIDETKPLTLDNFVPYTPEESKKKDTVSYQNKLVTDKSLIEGHNKILKSLGLPELDPENTTHGALDESQRMYGFKFKQEQAGKEDVKKKQDEIASLQKERSKVSKIDLSLNPMMKDRLSEIDSRLSQLGVAPSEVEKPIVSEKRGAVLKEQPEIESPPPTGAEGHTEIDIPKIVAEVKNSAEFINKDYKAAHGILKKKYPKHYSDIWNLYIMK